jgi:anthranilate phosphoribosyltransferase
VLRDLIHQLVDGQDLTEGQMIDGMEAIMGGEATHAQMAAFLTALRIKGETVDEIAGAARVMRESTDRGPMWRRCSPDPAETESAARTRAR